MTTKRRAEIIKEAYNVAYGFDGTYGVPEGFETFLDIYENKKAVAEFLEMPAQFIPYDKPVNKAKEIALEAAIQLSGRLPTQITFGKDKEEKEEPSPVLALAMKIYKWLIEPETDKQ